MDPQGPMGIVSTLLLFPLRVKGLVSPSSLTLTHLSVLQQPQFHLQHNCHLSHPVGKKHRLVSFPLHRALLHRRLNGGLIHLSTPTAPRPDPESAQRTESQEVMQESKDMLLWERTGALRPLPPGLRCPRGRVWPSVPQRAPLLCAAPHLWKADVWVRPGESGTVV